MDEEGPLNLDLDRMTVEDYTNLLVAMGDDDHFMLAKILDKYVEGGLMGRHWLNFWLVIDQADAQIEAGRNALKTASAASGFMSILMKKRRDSLLEGTEE